MLWVLHSEFERARRFLGLPMFMVAEAGLALSLKTGIFGRIPRQSPSFSCLLRQGGFVRICSCKEQRAAHLIVSNELCYLQQG